MLDKLLDACGAKWRVACLMCCMDNKCLVVCKTILFFLKQHIFITCLAQEVQKAKSNTMGKRHGRTSPHNRGI